MYFYLSEADRDTCDLSGFNPRELDVLDCIYRFSLNVWDKRRSVESFATLLRALQRAGMLRQSGGRASLYAVRRCTNGEDWYSHISLAIANKLRTVDEPELPPMNINASWSFAPRKPVKISEERKRLALIREELDGPRTKEGSADAVRRRLE